MKNCLFSLLCFLVLLNSHLLNASSQSAGFGGATTITGDEGNVTSPEYYIVSAGLSGDPVYSGVVADSWDGNNSLFFASEQNSTLDYVAPFRDSAFDVDILLPRVTATLSDPPDSVQSITVDYIGDYSIAVNGFNGSNARFVEAPEIIISPPGGNVSSPETATAIATITSGELEIPSANINGGSGYTEPPKVTIVGGPHFVKITDPDSSYYGRVFLIQDNGPNTLSFGNLTITQRLSSTESSTTLSTFFPDGTSVEIYAAQTLGNLFGLDTDDLVGSNWTSKENANDVDGSDNGADLIYFWNEAAKGFQAFFFSTRYKPSTYTGSNDNFSWGWKTTDSAFYPKTRNNRVIYPDESFLIAKRSSGTFSLVTEGSLEIVDKKLFLPASGNSALLNNPYGTDLMLAELIPSHMIGTGSGQFRPGVDDDSGDAITLLQSDVWKTYYYDSNHGNTGVTKMHEIGVRRPLDASGNIASTIDADDLYIGSGSVTGMQSCSDAAGTTPLTSGNDSNFTKISINSSGTRGNNSGLKGFSITFEDINGRLLHDDGEMEANSTNPDETQDVGNGSIVFSKLCGKHEIVGSGTGFVVINIQRDVNFIGLGADAGSPTWSIGTLGTGYDQNATFYLIGGGASSNASGTVPTNGDIQDSDIASGGDGYSGKPQVITSGGGWRISSAPNSQGNTLLGASEGIFIQRQVSGGEKTFIDSLNPFE